VHHFKNSIPYSTLRLQKEEKFNTGQDLNKENRPQNEMDSRDQSSTYRTIDMEENDLPNSDILREPLNVEVKQSTETLNLNLLNSQNPKSGPDLAVQESSFSSDSSEEEYDSYLESAKPCSNKTNQNLMANTDFFQTDPITSIKLFIEKTERNRSDTGRLPTISTGESTYFSRPFRNQVSQPRTNKIKHDMLFDNSSPPTIGKWLAKFDSEVDKYWKKITPQDRTKLLFNHFTDEAREKILNIFHISFPHYIKTEQNYKNLKVFITRLMNDTIEHEPDQQNILETELETVVPFTDPPESHDYFARRIIDKVRSIVGTDAVEKSYNKKIVWTKFFESTSINIASIAKNTTARPWRDAQEKRDVIGMARLMDNLATEDGYSNSTAHNSHFVFDKKRIMNEEDE